MTIEHTITIDLDVDLWAYAVAVANTAEVLDSRLYFFTKGDAGDQATARQDANGQAAAWLTAYEGASIHRNF